MRYSITGGRIVDPANQLDQRLDLHITDNQIAGVGPAPEGFQADALLCADGLVVAPGLVDLSARLREPGEEHKATIASETRAAVRGGITTLCIPPDTDPVVDSPAVVELIHQRASAAGRSWVEVQGALTKDLAGERLAEMGTLAQVGCVGLSNARHSIADSGLMRRALEYAATFDLTVFLTPEDPWLAEGGRVHEGSISTILGLPGIPECAETVTLARDLLLVEQSGVRAHFNQISTARGAAMIAEARDRGLPVSADVTAHHLYLTDQDIAGYDTLAHVCPPLRSARDRDALREAVKAGHLSAICSDHQPHEPDAKNGPFSTSDPGISGLETLLPLALELGTQMDMPLSDSLARLTQGPAGVLGRDTGSLSPGAPADVVVFDPEASWSLDPDNMLSRGHNSPFVGRELTGRVVYTVVRGEAFRADDLSPALKF